MVQDHRCGALSGDYKIMIVCEIRLLTIAAQQDIAYTEQMLFQYTGIQQEDTNWGLNSSQLACETILLTTAPYEVLFSMLLSNLLLPSVKVFVLSLFLSNFNIAFYSLSFHLVFILPDSTLLSTSHFLCFYHYYSFPSLSLSCTDTIFSSDYSFFF